MLKGENKEVTGKEIHVKVMRVMHDRFRQFTRNGVWGTCVACPCDTNGQTYPEFCNNKTRSDHLLTPEELFEQYGRFTATEFRKTQEAG